MSRSIMWLLIKSIPAQVRLISRIISGVHVSYLSRLAAGNEYLLPHHVRVTAVLLTGIASGGADLVQLTG
jgi:hypothetical protein